VSWWWQLVRLEYALALFCRSTKTWLTLLNVYYEQNYNIPYWLPALDHYHPALDNCCTAWCMWKYASQQSIWCKYEN